MNLPANLTSGDVAQLDRRLAREADMAYRRRVKRLMEHLELRDGLRILDCGCGMGASLILLDALRAVRLVGLDLEMPRLVLGRTAGVPAGLVGADLRRTPFPDAAFDRVLLSEALEHVRDDRIALAEMFRILRPGGVLAISVPHADYPFLWDPIHKTWEWLGGRPIRRGPLVGIWTGHERLYRPDELADRVSAAGFVPEIVEETTHWAFPFSHFLLYGVGKPLIENRLLPGWVRRGLDRLSRDPIPRAGPDLLSLALWPLRVIDRLNERPGELGSRTWVNVLVKARKPLGYKG